MFKMQIFYIVLCACFVTQGKEAVEEDRASLKLPEKMNNCLECFNWADCTLRQFLCYLKKFSAKLCKVCKGHPKSNDPKAERVMMMDDEIKDDDDGVSLEQMPVAEAVKAQARKDGDESSEKHKEQLELQTVPRFRRCEIWTADPGCRAFERCQLSKSFGP